MRTTVVAKRKPILQERCCPTCLRLLVVVNDEQVCPKHGKPTRP